MKQQNSIEDNLFRRAGLALRALAAAAVIAPAAALAQNEIQWRPDGNEEEQWYDPRDWFDGDSADISSDYAESDFYGGYWDGYAWYSDIDYEEDYAADYEWDNDSNRWNPVTVEDYAFSAKYDYDRPEDPTLGVLPGRQSEARATTAESGDQKSGDADADAASSTLSGVVKDFRKMDLGSEGYERTHALARIELSNGQLAVVDLGLDDLVHEDLKSGEKVTLHGDVGSIADSPVFVVSRIETESGDSIYIDRAIARGQAGGRAAAEDQGAAMTSNDVRRDSKSGAANRSDRQQSSAGTGQITSQDRSTGEAKELEAPYQSDETITGTLENLRIVALSPDSSYREKHVVASIAIEGGKSTVVDLGLQELVSDNLEPGQTVTIRGSRGQIDGEPYFLATSISAGDDTIYIDRAFERSGSAAGKASQVSSKERQIVVEGDVAAIESATPEGQSESQRFAKIRLQSGRAVTVNLGPDTSLRDLDVQPGDRIRIQGRVDTLEGRRVITAQTISVGGERVKG